LAALASSELLTMETRRGIQDFLLGSANMDIDFVIELTAIRLRRCFQKALLSMLVLGR
jgi:hypothetical protein